jgi:hypothetical protein
MDSNTKQQANISFYFIFLTPHLFLYVPETWNELILHLPGDSAVHSL